LPELAAHALQAPPIKEREDLGALLLGAHGDREVARRLEDALPDELDHVGGAVVEGLYLSGVDRRLVLAEDEDDVLVELDAPVAAACAPEDGERRDHED